MEQETLDPFDGLLDDLVPILKTPPPVPHPEENDEPGLKRKRPVAKKPATRKAQTAVSPLI